MDDSPRDAGHRAWPVSRRTLVALDCLVAAVYTGVLLTQTLAPGRAHAPGVPLWVDALVAAVVGLPGALRRLWPVPVLCAVMAASLAAVLLGVLRDPFLAACYALYTIASTRRPRGGAAVPALGAATAAGFVGLLAFGLSVPAVPPRWANHLGLVPAGFVAMAGTFTVGHAVRERRAYAARWADQLARRAVTEERLRIARELHDIVAHSLSLITVKAGTTHHVATRAGARPDDAVEALRVIEAEGRGALTEMRRMLGVLRSETAEDLAPAPGVAALPALAERAAAAGVRVDLDVRGTDGLPEGVELSIYRIVQEAVTNVVKHAAPARCRVRIRADGREARIDVTDDGPGRRVLPPDAAGHGLTGMRERAMMYGGTFTAGPRPEGGFGVSARLPYGPAGARTGVEQ
ncbi:sensor histidine kinase [Microtetraspora niveoalba]|uniref:sensor histidine kinase n=1 Tax=Microtetraspora niveoalba TaxID=46175 RepID=UPI00082B084E|nr:sensor histidine kinase [Microtetraspora niveoalba]